MSKQDRQGARTPAEIERKYDLGKTLSDLESKAKANAEQITKQGQRIDSVAKNHDERFSSLEKGITNAEKSIVTLKENVTSLQIRMVNSEEKNETLENELLKLERRVSEAENDVEQLKKVQEIISSINSLYKRFTPRNLLDNSDFRNVVNQRGGTSYTGGSGVGTGYGIDRWYINRANAILTINNDGIEIDNSANSANTAILTERVILPASGEYTVALETDEGLCFATYTLNGTTLSQVGKNDLQKCKIQLAVSGGLLAVQIVTSAGAVAVCKWASLYEGEYTADTLPEYQPKGYGAELSECRRYFKRFGSVGVQHYGYAMAATATSTNATLPIAEEMIVKYPTVTVSGNIVLRKGITDTAVTSASVLSAQGGILHIIINSTGLTVGEVYAIRFNAGAYIDVSADL